MRKICFMFLWMMCSCTLQLNAQQKDVARKELHDLLNERKEKFDSYTASIEKRSGIFGNQTKKDVRRSNEVLIEIVKTDNKIISALNRVADFKDYERVNLTYDLNQRNDNTQNLLQATDTLAKQVDALTADNKALKLTNQKQTLLVYALSIFCFVMILVWIIKRRR